MEEQPDPNSPQLSSERQRDIMLAEVLMDAEAKSTARKPGPARGTTWTRIIVAAVSVAAAVWVWVFPPPFLTQPAPPPQSAARAEAGLRLGVALQVERVLAHRDQVRRLPDLLREVDDTLPGMIYTRVDASTFVLRGRSGDLVLEYRSGDALSEFLGDAVQILGGPE